MKKVGVGILLATTVMLIYKSCTEDKQRSAIIQENSALLKEQWQQTAKLVVNEGHFSEIYTFKDSQELFGKWLTAEKKALVVVNAEVQILYDLEKVSIEIDEEGKRVLLKDFPDPEIKINPDFEYYDISDDYFNPFEASDYNTIKKNVTLSLDKKIRDSELLNKAQDRLISELSKYYVLTSHLGWELIYEDKIINKLEELKMKKHLLD